MEEKRSRLGVRKHLTILGWVCFAVSLVIPAISFALNFYSPVLGVLYSALISAAIVLNDLGWKRMRDRNRYELFVTITVWVLLIVLDVLQYFSDNNILNILMFGIFCFMGLCRSDLRKNGENKKE